MRATIASVFRREDRPGGVKQRACSWACKVALDLYTCARQAPRDVKVNRLLNLMLIRFALAD